MAFTSTPSESARTGIILLVGISVAGWYLFNLLAPNAIREAQIVAALEQNPGDLIMLEAVETYFPDDHEDLIDAMSDALARNASTEQILAVGQRELGEFLYRHRNDFGNAPGPALVAALDADIALLEALQEEDPGACSAYAFGIGLFEGVPSDPTLELLGTAVATKVQAMSAGRTDQQMRLAITPPMTEALVADMQDMGVSDAQVTVGLEGSDEYVMADEQRCEVALVTRRAVARQDEYARDLFIGKLLAAARPD